MAKKLPRRKWVQLRGSVWAVFTEREVPWLVTFSKSRGGAIRMWLKDGGFRGQYAEWDYWVRCGYTVRRLSLRMRLH